MKLTHSVRYDAPVDDVYAMLTDPAFREKAALAQGVTSVDVSVDGGTITLEMQQPNTDLPGFARKIVGDDSRVIQAEAWNGSDSADFSITIPGTPGSISGVRTLKADGDGTLDSFDGEAKAKIPLVGGKLEGLIATKLKEGWDGEHVVGTAWLAGER
jgi:uncharacterized protein YndB with AHSA1/START domain